MGDVKGQPVDAHQPLLAWLARKFAARELTWRDIRCSYDIWYGDLLNEVGHQRLPMPFEPEDDKQRATIEKFVAWLKDADDARYAQEEESRPG